LVLYNFALHWRRLFLRRGMMTVFDGRFGIGFGWLAGWNGFCVAHGMIEAAFLLIGIRIGVRVLI
jgi:hypothetical protein